MSDNLVFTINFDTLLRTGLGVNQFTFLTLLKHNKSNLFEEYRSQEKSIGRMTSMEIIEDLIDKGWLLRIDNSEHGKKDARFSNFKVTDKFNELVDVNNTDIIQELKDAYPKKTPSGNRVNLQQDSDKWIPKYLKAIGDNKDLHNIVLKCIEAEKINRKKTKAEEYWALLTTYVNNRRWEVYINNIDNIQDSSVFERDI